MIARLSRKYAGFGSFFDCGWIARVPVPVRQLANHDVIDRGEWHLVLRDVRQMLAPLFAPTGGTVDKYTEDNISLFHNTTSAFQRVLTRLDQEFSGSHPTLLTTDLEFPGCVAAIDDVWSGPLVVAQVAGEVLALEDPHAAATSGADEPDSQERGEFDAWTEGDELLHNMLLNAVDFIRPRIVFLSHVMRTNGQVISHRTLEAIKDGNPRVVIVVDGSQAIGNVVLTEDFLRHVDFYIACGHKWLGGMTTTGFVWQRDPRMWRLPDPAHSLDYLGHQGGTGSVPAWVSLRQSIQDLTEASNGSSMVVRLSSVESHNRDLGEVLYRRLASVHPVVGFVSPAFHGRPRSGLVTIRVRDKVLGRKVTSALRLNRVAFTVIEGDSLEAPHVRLNSRFHVYKLRSSSGPLVSPITHRATMLIPRTVAAQQEHLRFCLHYYHSERNVRNVAQVIRSAL